MLAILGAGSAIPGTEISAAVLNDLQAAGAGEPAFLAGPLRSCLPLNYLRETGNEKPLPLAEIATRFGPLTSATELGVEACRQALAVAGIAADEVGLLLADCATPEESCPSEAQRIAGKLGLDVPAYDVSAGSAALALHIATLDGWKSERRPKATLCVSANTPTRFVNFRKGAARMRFSDAAAAVVIGERRAAPALSVRGAEFRGGKMPSKLFGLDPLGVIEGSAGASSEETIELLKAALAACGGSSGVLTLVPPSLAPRAAEIAASCGAAVQPGAEYECFGSAAGLALAACWKELTKPGSKLAAALCGAGLGSGWIALEAAA